MPHAIPIEASTAEESLLLSSLVSGRQNLLYGHLAGSFAEGAYSGDGFFDLRLAYRLVRLDPLHGTGLMISEKGQNELTAATL
jgi:hypothetical protein